MGEVQALVAGRSQVTDGPRIKVAPWRLDALTDAEAAAWDALHASAAGVTNPFASRTWVTTWYRHFAPSDALALAVTERDRLIGFAPFYRRRVQVGPVPVVRRWQLVGAGVSTPLEIPPLLCAPGQGRAVTRTLVENLLTPDVTWAELCLAREHGWLATQDLATPDGRAVFARYQQVRACVVLPLAPTWEATRGALKKNAKESVRRAVNRLAKDGRPWRIHHRTGSDLDLDAVDRLLTLHAARSRTTRSAVHHSDAYADPAVAAFMRDLLPRLGQAGEATLAELELDGETVAAQLILHPPGGVYFHSSGFLPHVWDLSPVTALQVDVLRAAIDRGERWANFSPGPNEAKLRWSDELVLWNDVAVGPARRGALVRYAAFAVAKDARQLSRELDRDARTLASRSAPPRQRTAGSGIPAPGV